MTTRNDPKYPTILKALAEARTQHSGFIWARRPEGMRCFCSCGTDITILRGEGEQPHHRFFGHLDSYLAEAVLDSLSRLTAAAHDLEAINAVLAVPESGVGECSDCGRSITPETHHIIIHRDDDGQATFERICLADHAV